MCKEFLAFRLMYGDLAPWLPWQPAKKNDENDFLNFKNKIKLFFTIFVSVTIPYWIKATYFNSYFLSNMNSLGGESVNRNADRQMTFFYYIVTSWVTRLRTGIFLL